MSKSRKIKLEDYRLGYPRLAAFLNVDKNFSILKRFDNLNLRVLLEKQDRLAQLEEQLNKCDDDEALQLHLGSRRQDENSRRRELMGYIETELEAYGAAVLRYQQLTSIPAARKSRRESVYNWFIAYKPLVRSESGCFLTIVDDDDYMSLKEDGHDRAGLEDLFDIVAKLCPSLTKYICSSKAKTDDANIVLFPQKRFKILLKYAVAFMIPIWLICPGILLYTIRGQRNRATISAVFTFGASFMIAFLTNATKYNLLLAVVAYAAVLSAFLSGS